MTSQGQHLVLLVEDNPGDVALTCELLEDGPVPVRVEAVGDGERALARLQSNEQTPTLVLLDLNLPRLSGHEVLETMRNDPELALLPVVVVSSSDADSDVRRSYEAGANCYVVKPLGIAEHEALLRSLSTFWLTQARLP